METANQRSWIGLGVHRQASGREGFLHEGIDRFRADRDCGHGWPNERLKGPVIKPLNASGHILRDELGERLHGVRPDRAGRDPIFQELLFVGGERLALCGHP